MLGSEIERVTLRSYEKHSWDGGTGLAGTVGMGMYSIYELLLLLGPIGVKLALDLRTMGEERLALRTVLTLRDVRCLLIGLNQVDDIFGILG